MSNVGNNWIQKIPLTAKLEILAVLGIFFIKLWITSYGQQVVLLHKLIVFFFLENGWEQKTRLPIVVGPVDGTHIPNYATMPQLTRSLLLQNEVHNQCEECLRLQWEIHRCGH